MSQRGSVPTNEHIVRLLEAVRADLADAKKRQEEIARNLEWRPALAPISPSRARKPQSAALRPAFADCVC
jgi:hypothetical protein